MKKKTLAIVLVVCLLATALVSGTLAYFTDKDGAENVFTVGNVSIIQDETNEKGEEFVDNQKLFPYTGDGTDKDENKIIVNGDYCTNEGVMDPADNWISKIVTVKNNGSEDAYVRTLFAFQILKDAEGKDIIAADPATGDLAYRAKHGLMYDLYQAAGSINFAKDANGAYLKYTDANGVEYIVGEYLYKMDLGNGKYDSMLKAGERSHASLKSVALESYVDNEVAALYKDYKILVVSQAVQTKGFTDANGNGVVADDALNEAFGAATESAKYAEWFKIAQ
ncbi:MAG: hypothetical protein E7218_01190 [Anaerofustis stercorihominis]|nr:hypothetical protein [Anaerofustis stercorihominis]